MFQMFQRVKRQTGGHTGGNNKVKSNVKSNVSKVLQSDKNVNRIRLNTINEELARFLVKKLNGKVNRNLNFSRGNLFTIPKSVTKRQLTNAITQWHTVDKAAANERRSKQLQAQLELNSRNTIGKRLNRHKEALSSARPRVYVRNTDKNSANTNVRHIFIVKNGIFSQVHDNGIRAVKNNKNNNKYVPVTEWKFPSSLKYYYGEPLTKQQIVNLYDTRNTPVPVLHPTYGYYTTNYTRNTSNTPLFTNIRR